MFRTPERLLLEPKHVIPEKFKDRKVFFLSGPIRGGGGWQMHAANAIWEKVPGSIVVDPTRWEEVQHHGTTPEERWSAKNHRSYSIGSKDKLLYPSQIPWEKYHMNLASRTGCLLFWFERESQRNPRPLDEGVYAQDTRVESGIWIEKLANNPNLKVKFGGHWELDSTGRETRKSFGGLNFISFYLTSEPDRRKIHSGEVTHPNLVLANNIEDFIVKAV